MWPTVPVEMLKIKCFLGLLNQNSANITQFAPTVILPHNQVIVPGCFILTNGRIFTSAELRKFAFHNEVINKPMRKKKLDICWFGDNYRNNFLGYENCFCGTACANGFLGVQKWFSQHCNFISFLHQKNCQRKAVKSKIFFSKIWHISLLMAY